VKRDRRLIVRFSLSLTALLVASACSSTSEGGPVAAAIPDRASATSPAAPTPDAEGDPSADPSGSGSATPTAAPSRKRSGASVSAADRRAGIRSRRVVDRLSGRLVTVRGSATAPGKGRVMRIKVQVESGLPVDGRAFAAFVMDTLNDPRSWGRGGRRTFARTDGAYDVRVVLASPQTSRAMCRPLETLGRLSCRSGDAAVLTYYRWVNAHPDYGRDRTGYRNYVVNHEIGHALGHGHVGCPGRGEPAPVMMQQTKGLVGCEPNPWPFP
jgi:hypothetical protein